MMLQLEFSLQQKQSKSTKKLLNYKFGTLQDNKISGL